jgi:hypothetical protein
VGLSTGQRLSRLKLCLVMLYLCNLFKTHGSLCHEYLLCFIEHCICIILLLYVWIKHPGHTYRGFGSTFSDRGMTAMLPTLLHDLGNQLTISQQGIHTWGYSSPGLAISPWPRRGGLQSPNRTITPTGTTLPCKAWSFNKGFKPGHHIRQPMKYKKTHQRRLTIQATRSESNLPSRTDNP